MSEVYFHDPKRPLGDIVDRLGWHAENHSTGKLALRNPDGPEAAAEIARLRAENERLREALADLVGVYDYTKGTTDWTIFVRANARARAVLKGERR